MQLSTSLRQQEIIRAIAGRVSFLFEGEKEIPGGATALKINNANEPTFAFVKQTSTVMC